MSVSPAREATIFGRSPWVWARLGPAWFRGAWLGPTSGCLGHSRPQPRGGPSESPNSNIIVLRRRELMLDGTCYSSNFEFFEKLYLILQSNCLRKSDKINL